MKINEYINNHVFSYDNIIGTLRIDNYFTLTEIDIKNLIIYLKLLEDNDFFNKYNQDKDKD